jgi:hypothetical protein
MNNKQKEQFSLFASMLHADFDLDRQAFSEGISLYIKGFDQERRRHFLEMLAAALQDYPTSRKFERAFISSGADAWPGDARDEVEEFLRSWPTQNP